MPRCTEQASPARRTEHLCPSPVVHWLQSKPSCVPTCPAAALTSPSWPGGTERPPARPHHLPGVSTGTPRAQVDNQRCLSPTPPGKLLAALFPAEVAGCSRGCSRWCSSKALMWPMALFTFFLPSLRATLSLCHLLPEIPTENKLPSLGQQALESHFQVLSCPISPAIT